MRVLCILPPTNGLAASGSLHRDKKSGDGQYPQFLFVGFACTYSEPYELMTIFHITQLTINLLSEFHCEVPE